MNNTLKKGIAVGGTILTLGAGGVVATDRAIDPYVDKGTVQELSIVSDIPQGERVEIHKDKAQMDIVFWNDENRISIKPQIPISKEVFGAVATDRDFKVEGDRALLSKKIEYKQGDVTAFIEPKEGSENEFDIDFTLDTNPGTNVFEYVIEGADQFDFFYQPALTEEEIAEGDSRPDNVVGSYAVYHKTKANHKIGDTNYGTGKAFHIYRPKAIDANGNEVWAELKYEPKVFEISIKAYIDYDGSEIPAHTVQETKQVLSVVVPQDFLDKATYPVRVDPTFGYTTGGGSASSNNNFVAGTEYALEENGSVSKLTMSLSLVNNVNNTTQGTGAMYTSGNVLVATTSENAAIVGTTKAWYDFTYSASQSLTTATYWLTLGGSNDSDQILFSYDSNTVVVSSRVAFTYPTFTDPYVPSADNNRAYSIYATYTYTPSVAFSSSNYSQCKLITVDNTKVAADLSSFPMLIDLTDSDLAADADSNGGDVTFTDSSGNPLFHEQELYASGRLVAHASTTLANSSDTVIRMYYGSTTSVDNYEVPTAVWDKNYVSVWHLGDDDSYALTDSKNVNNAAGTGTLNNGTGQMGYGLDVGGGTSYASSTTTGFPTGTGAATMSFWLKLDGGSNWAGALGYGTSSYLRAFAAYNYYSLDLHELWGGGGSSKVISATVPTTLKYYSLHITGGTTYATYQNGTLVGSGNYASGDPWDILPAVMYMGIGPVGYGSMDGVLDEVRISNISRSADWITTEYNNQSATSTFYTISAEYDNTCAAGGGGGSVQDAGTILKGRAILEGGAIIR